METMLHEQLHEAIERANEADLDLEVCQK